MSAQLKFPGRTPRRALLSLLAAVAISLAGGAAQANAASVTAIPSIQGAGSLSGAVGCVNGSLLNGTTVGCVSAVVDTGFFSNFASMALTATPRPQSVADGKWEFVGWEGCPTPAGSVCIMSAGLFQFLTFFPKAVFREVVDTARVSGPGQFTNNKTNTFGYSTALGTTFECRLDGALVSCGARGSDGKASSTHAVTTDGTHNFVVAALSSRGNRSATPFTFTYIVDTVKPTAVLGAATSVAEGAVTTLLSATFAFASNEIGTFECSLDSAEFSACTSPTTLNNLQFGGRTFAVRSVDRAGNRSDPVTRGWTVNAKDNDGDGFNQRADCDDGNPAINPIAPDVPDNGVDENCDGSDATDPDRDDDGFAPPADCNDSNASIRPGVTDVPDNNIDENCDGSDTKSDPPTKIAIGMPFAFSKSTKKFTVFTVLQVTGSPSGSTLKVVCKAPKGKKCPASSFTQRNAKSKVSLKKWLKTKLAAGTTLTVTVTKAGNFIGAVKTMTVKKKSRPSFTDRCLPPGAKKPTKC